MKEPCIEQASGKYDWIIPGLTYLLKTLYKNYSQTYNIRGTLVYNKLVDHLDVAGAPVGAGPTASTFST